LRDTEVSGIEIALSPARPMTISSPSSTYSLPACGPARQTSFAPSAGAGAFTAGTFAIERRALTAGA
jgi:hypothetical protein